MKVVLFAHQNWGLKAIDAFTQSNIEIVKVFTHPLDMDMHENVWYDAISPYCEQKNIVVSERTKLTDEDVAEIQSLQPDLIFSAGWRRLLPDSLFSIPKHGVLNLHDGKIPEYRGFAPINWAVINGEDKLGITIHYIDEGIDTGDIILQKEIPLSLHETAFDGYNKLLELSTTMIVDVIKMIKENKVVRTSQNILKPGFFCSRRFPHDGKINWNSNPIQIYNLIRALCDPYPNAFFIFENKKYYVKEAKLEQDDYRGTPGRISAIKENGIVVTCGNDHKSNQSILLTKISDGEQVYDANKLFSKLWVDLL